MFHSARLKLTLWYVIIVALISGVFSFVLYKTVTAEIRRGFQTAEQRMENVESPVRRMARLHLLSEEYETARRSVRRRLMYFNGIVLILATIASYHFAGETLKPIEEAHKAQEQFIADASHELRTPLTALRTSIEVGLREKKLSLAQAKTLLHENLTDITHLQLLTDNLLFFIRHDTHAASETVHVEKIIATVIRKLHALSDTKHIHITHHLTPVTVQGIAVNVERLFTAVIDNAIKYSQENGHITIVLKSMRNCAVATITDTGSGIAKKDIPYVFNRFYRAEVSRSKKQGDGFGLGLPLARHIAGDMGGSIAIKSKISKGTTVTIRIPRSK